MHNVNGDENHKNHITAMLTILTYSCGYNIALPFYDFCGFNPSPLTVCILTTVLGRLL